MACAPGYDCVDYVEFGEVQKICLEEEGNGVTHCEIEVCQAGQYCDSFFDECDSGCESDANCEDDEFCLDEDSCVEFWEGCSGANETVNSIPYSNNSIVLPDFTDDYSVKIFLEAETTYYYRVTQGAGGPIDDVNISVKDGDCGSLSFQSSSVTVYTSSFTTSYLGNYTIELTHSDVFLNSVTVQLEVDFGNGFI